MTRGLQTPVAKANQRSRERRGEVDAIRLGQSFSLGEAIHATRMMEAVEAGDVALAQRLLRDVLGCNVRRKFVAMRDRGRIALARAATKAEAPIPFELTEKGKEAL